MRFGLKELVVLLIVGCVGVALALPSIEGNARADNERSASASLREIARAQADFRTNDRDGNLVNDYWTRDVWALYALVPGPLGSTVPSPDLAIRLIEPSVAGADGRSDMASYGSATISRGRASMGYFFRAFGAEEEGGVVTTLHNDTDGPNQYYGLVHDRTRFAFAALPCSLRAGKLMFIVNGDSSIWKLNLAADYVATFTPMVGPRDSVSTAQFAQELPSAVFRFDGRIGGGAVFPQSPGSNGCSHPG